MPYIINKFVEAGIGKLVLYGSGVTFENHQKNIFLELPKKVSDFFVSDKNKSSTLSDEKDQYGYAIYDYLYGAVEGTYIAVNKPTIISIGRAMTIGGEEKVFDPPIIFEELEFNGKLSGYVRCSSRICHTSMKLKKFNPVSSLIYSQNKKNGCPGPVFQKIF